jgi:hypothetical protein
MGWVYPLDVHESIVTKEIAHENKGLGAFFFFWREVGEKRREEKKMTKAKSQQE